MKNTTRILTGIGIFMITVTMMALAGCKMEDDKTMIPDELMNQIDEKSKKEEAMENHIGCQEGEIDEFGNCWPAVESMAKVFIQGDVDTRDAEYGFIAKPAKQGDYPGVIMIHEWWGLNDNVKDMAKVLAKEGYIVYAVDLYGGEAAVDSGRAGELAGSVRNNPEQAITIMKQAVDYLKEQENVISIGSIGWCFGGEFSLQLALSQEMDATVIYYGQLTDDKEMLANINWPVLGIFGSEDTSITPEMVRSFESALNELGIENDINIYEGAGHAFANPSGSRYRQKEAVDAWEKTIRFLNKNLKKGLMQIGEEDPVSIDIEIRDFSFSPAEITIDKGGSVTWINYDSVRHTATSDVIGIFDSGLFSNKESWTYTFDEAGEYPYHCTPHPSMKGRIIVK